MYKLLDGLPFSEVLELINNYLALRMETEEQKSEELILAVNHLKQAKASLKESRASFKEVKVDGRSERRELKQELRTKKLRKKIKKRLAKLLG